MNNNIKDNFLDVYREFHDLKIAEEIDFSKFYLYSIITHSTAIEGSTITEEENYNLFENGITEGIHEIKEFKQKENNEIKLHLNKVSNNNKKRKIL